MLDIIKAFLKFLDFTWKLIYKFIAWNWLIYLVYFPRICMQMMHLFATSLDLFAALDF